MTSSGCAVAAAGGGENTRNATLCDSSDPHTPLKRTILCDLGAAVSVLLAVIRKTYDFRVLAGPPISTGRRFRSVS